MRCAPGARPSGKQNPSHLTTAVLFLPFLLNSFFKPRETLKEKRMHVQVAPEAGASTAVTGHGAPATRDKLFFIRGNISSLAFITPLLNTAHVTQCNSRAIREKAESWAFSRAGRGVVNSRH